jgi:hypothetical protein
MTVAMIRYFNPNSIHASQLILVVASSPGDSVRYVVRSPARHRVARATPRLGILRTPVETARRKSLTVNCLFKNTRDLLGERTMFGSRASTK